MSSTSAWRRSMAYRATLVAVSTFAAPGLLVGQGLKPATPRVAQAGGASATPSRDEASAPPLDALVARALERAPSLSAQRARLNAARAEVDPASALSDPTVEFEYRDDGFPRYTIGRAPMSMVGATFRQPLGSPGRRSARRALALAAVDQRHAEADNVACDLIMEVREQYARLYALDREEATLADAAEIADLLVTTASTRYAAGTTDQAAVLRAQLERTRLGERLVDLRAERRQVQAILNRLTDDPPGAPIGRVRDLPAIQPSAASPEDEAARVAMPIQLRQAEVGVATRQVEAARQELRSSYSVGAGVYWEGGTDRLAVITVGIELPVWKERKQRPRVVAAQQELEAARSDAAATAAEVRSEAAALVIAWRQADEQVERYRTAILPQTSAVLDATRASYLGGRGDFTAVAEEFRRWIEVRVELARREAASFTARARLDVLVSPPEHGDWMKHGEVAAVANEKEGQR